MRPGPAAVLAALLLGLAGSSSPAFAATVTEVPGPAAESPGAQLSVAVEPGSGAVGTEVVVRLAGWPAGNVAVEICGNRARRGSADCAVGAAATVAITRAGTAAVRLRISRPPVGCPCVVRARQVGGGAEGTTSVRIAGMSSLARPLPVTTTPTELTVVRARLSGPGWSWELLGGPGTRTLTVTIRNTGKAPVSEPRITWAVGRPGRTSSGDPPLVISSPAPGGEDSFTVPVRLDAPVWGHYTVRGEVSGADHETVFFTHTRTYPWLLLVPLGVVLAGLIRVRRRPGAPAGRVSR